MSKKIGAIVSGAVLVVESIIGSKKIQSAIFGTYSDGSPKSLTDAIDGECFSPNQKKKMAKRKKKKKSRPTKLKL